MREVIQKLRCLFGRHDFLVTDSLMAATTDMECRECRKKWEVPVKHEKFIQTSVNLEFRENQGICYDIYRNKRKVLTIRYDRADAIKQGKAFIDIASKLVRKVV